MSDTVAAITGLCVARGLDLSATVQVGRYNDLVPPAHQLPDLGDRRSVAILIGNTRRLWPHFMQALASTPGLAALPDPLDHYVESVVRSACQTIETPHAVRWAHKPEPFHISFQTLAEVAGLAWRSPASLSVHPEFGSWIALRAAVVVAECGPQRRVPLTRPCHACESGCEKYLNRVLQKAASARWQDWLAVRDSCPLGRAWRYTDRQIEYHYTKSSGLLLTNGSG